MSKCDAIRGRLAEDGVKAALSVIEIKRHVEGCADCARFLDELGRVEAALAELPEHDAPDALVAETLRAVRKAAEAETATPPSGPQRYVAVGLAASVVIAAGLGLTLSREWLGSQPMTVALLPEEPSADFYDGRTGDRDGAADRLAKAPAAGEGKPADEPQSYELPEPAPTMTELDAARSLQDLERSEARPAQQGAYRHSAEPFADEKSRREEIVSTLQSRDLDFLGSLRERGAEQPVPPSAVTVEGQSLSATGAAASKPDTRQGLAGAGEVTGGRRADLGNELPETESVTSDDKAEENKRRAQIAPAELEPAPTLAAAFLERYRTLDGLTYQEPTGYWSNSYIPGDSAMRLLEARLRDWDRSAFGRDVRLEQAAHPVVQPFDAPEDAALALYLNADQPAIEGPTRLRLQVGIKAAERQGGHRPAMNLGLLVDLRGGVEPESARRIRALLAALERARQPGDRFSLTVAGPDGGLLVAPDEFRHGPVRVAIERLFGGAGQTAPAAGLSLADAFALASRSVRAGDDPNAVLGSSLVLLVTGSSLADDLAAVERMAHLNAVAGVPTSVVSLAAREDLADIDRLVAAGQGNRRVLDRAEAADGVIDRELHASSRAVARALRLRIRLAPGVKLVDVLGSQRLDEALAQRVRDAEVAIDRRLARNLGIEADRGEDEEGIQIVIPNFYAGDSHTILLDVTAETPGPLADVTLRYKDVVYLRNGVARANLTLEDGRRAAGPLERNVLKNLVAWEFAQRTRQVGRYLADGDPRQAAAALASLRDLIRGLRGEVAGWQSDPDLVADEAMLEEYLTALAAPAAGDTVQRRYLADSLRYAAFRKLQTAAR